MSTGKKQRLDTGILAWGQGDEFLGILPLFRNKSTTL
jgi:hypothetical protein